MSPGGLITPLAIAALAAGAAALAWALDGLRLRFSETMEQVGEQRAEHYHGEGN